MIMNERIAELIGAIIGDGCIRYKLNMHQYYIEIVGDRIKEREYFNYLTNIIAEELGLTAHIHIIGRGLRLKFYSKEFLEYLVHSLKMSYNKNKGPNISIPSQILENESFLKSCLRGIFDTDGSVFLANKGYRNDYLTLEINTTSSALAHQLKEILSSKYRIGFCKHQRGNYLPLFKIALNGEKMVRKWFEEIGSSNQKHIERYNKSGTWGTF